MKLLGKRINYIRLYDFLNAIGAQIIESRLHLWFIDYKKQLDEHGTATVNGHTYNEEQFLDVLREEEGLLREIRFKKIDKDKIVTLLGFVSGNEYSALIQRNEQVGIILQFLTNYSENEEGVF